MNIFKLHSKNFICIGKEEFELLFRRMSFRVLDKEMRKQNLLLTDLDDNSKKMIEISGALSDKLDKNNDEVEIFAAFYMFLKHYDLDSKICFELKNSFNHRVDRINSYEKLKDVIEKNTSIDFGIELNHNLRLFQLKRYRNDLSITELFEYIKEKLAHYGNLDNINLLIILQTGGDMSKINFEELHKRLVEFKPTYNAQILIAYNEFNKTSVINQVFPELTTSRVPLGLNYDDLVSDYELREGRRV